MSSGPERASGWTWFERCTIRPAHFSLQMSGAGTPERSPLTPGPFRGECPVCGADTELETEYPGLD